MSNHPQFEIVAQEFAKTRLLTDVTYVASGAFKETYRCTKHDGSHLALKLFDPKKCNLAREQREINALQKCNSELVGKLYDHGNFNSSNGNFYFSIEEFLDGGTLTEKLNESTVLKHDLIKKYALSLVEALECLKANDLVHRDIKPDNIMFRRKDSHPVLVDFGLVRDLTQTSLTPTWIPHGPGTPYFSAPEQLNNEKQLIRWRTDQFSLGIVLGICLTGVHPFTENGMNEIDTVTAIASRKRCSVDFQNIANSFGFGWIVRMLEPWPVRRFAATTEILALINS